MKCDTSFFLLCGLTVHQHYAVIQSCCLFYGSTVLHPAKTEGFHYILDSRSMTDIFTLYKLPEIVVLKCFHCLKGTSYNCGIGMLSLGQITVC